MVPPKDGMAGFYYQRIQVGRIDAPAMANRPAIARVKPISFRYGESKRRNAADGHDDGCTSPAIE